MKKQIKFIIYGRPLVIKNNRQLIKTKSGFKIIKNTKIIRQFNECIKALEQQKNKYIKMGFNFPIKTCIMKYKFYYNNKKMADLSNLIEAPNDMLQKAGILKDDKLILTILPSYRILGSTEKTEIFIYPINELHYKKEE